MKPLSLALLAAVLALSSVGLAAPQAPPEPPLPELPPPAETPAPEQSPPPPAPAPSPVTPAPIYVYVPTLPVTSQRPDAQATGVDGAPAANTGFQLAIRLGYAVPFGSLAKSSPMTDTFNGQVPITFDIGGKLSKYVFLGAYFGIAPGGVASAALPNCPGYAQCTAMSAAVRFGAELQYNFLPDRTVNPWVGYGMGYEGNGISYTIRNQTTDKFVSGPEFGHFMGGVDFRLSKVFGLGPYVDFSLGRYTDRTITDPDGTRRDDSLIRRTWHEWLQIGIRGVLFP